MLCCTTISALPRQFFCCCRLTVSLNLWIRVLNGLIRLNSHTGAVYAKWTTPSLFKSFAMHCFSSFIQLISEPRLWGNSTQHIALDLYWYISRVSSGWSIRQSKVLTKTTTLLLSYLDMNPFPLVPSCPGLSILRELSNRKTDLVLGYLKTTNNKVSSTQ